MKKFLLLGFLIVICILVLPQGVLAGNTASNTTANVVAQIDISVGNTTIAGGSMVLGDNYNDSSLFCVVNATGSTGWTLSVQDSDAATKTTSPGSLSVGNMTSWSVGVYTSPWLQNNLAISGQGFGGPYVSLSGTAQQIVPSTAPVYKYTVPLWYKQTIVGGDMVLTGGKTYRMVVLFTGTSS